MKEYFVARIVLKGDKYFVESLSPNVLGTIQTRMLGSKSITSRKVSNIDSVGTFFMDSFF